MKIIWTSFAEENLKEITINYSETANKKVDIFDTRQSPEKMNDPKRRKY